MIIYYFMKWYLGWMAKLYYRRIYFKGYELIPIDKPAIFASNHPAAFMEPILLGSSVKQPLSFLVLASYIANRWLQWFFKALKMVPIYRADISGRESIQKNESTFRYVYENLRSNAHILIFPEASTSFTYKLRPLRKGLARMSVGFMDQNPDKDLFIVPVGVNFIDPGTFRSDVFIHVGSPVNLREIPYDGEEEAIRLNRIMKATFTGMQEVVYDISDEARHPIARSLIKIVSNQLDEKAFVIGKIWRNDSNQILSVRDLTAWINELPQEAFDRLEGKTNSYMKSLLASGISDADVSQSRFPFVILLFLVLAGFPLFLIGLFLNSFNLGVGWYIRTYRIERSEFIGPVTGAVSAITILVYTVLFLLLGIFVHFFFLVFIFAVPLSLAFSVFYYDLLKRFAGLIKFRCLSGNRKTELKKMRDQILTCIKKSDTEQ